MFRGPPWGSKGELVKTDMTETLLGSLALLLHKGVHAARLRQLGGAACLSLPACFSPSCLLTLGPSSWGLLAWNRLPQRDASRAHLLLGSGLRRRPPGAPLCPGADVPRNCLLCSLGIAFCLSRWEPGADCKDRPVTVLPLGLTLRLYVCSLPHPTSSAPKMEKLARAVLLKGWELPRGDRCRAHPRPWEASGQPAERGLFWGAVEGAAEPEGEPRPTGLGRSHAGD